MFACLRGFANPESLPCFGSGFASMAREIGIACKGASPARPESVTALCTHRPSLQSMVCLLSCVEGTFLEALRNW